MAEHFPLDTASESPDFQRWARLLMTYFDGDTNEPLPMEIEQELAAHPQFRRLFVEMASQRVALQRMFRSADAEVAQPRPGEAASSAVVLGWLGRTASAFSRPVVWSILAASLLFAGYVVVISWNMLSRDRLTAGSDGQDVVATIRDEADAQWSPDSRITDSSTSRGATIAQNQPLSIQSGLIELELKQGTKLLIEGPADWQITGENSATLTRGKLVAKVPRQAIGFTLNTPTSRIVDLGTEFGVEVGGGGAVEVHVLRGAVETIKLAADGTKPSGAKTTRLEAGSAIRIAPGSAPEERIAADRERFAAAKVSPDDAFLGAIPLGRLFDDRPPTSLAKAMDTDTFAAVPDSGHLGVESVFFGGDPVRRISRGVSFDLANLGWGGSRDGSVANDAVVGHGEQGRGAQIMTDNSSPTNPAEKKEAGVGMHANGLITFNLDEIRAAANRAGQNYRFVTDRAGVNSAAFGAVSSVYLLVVVSDDNKVLFATVNGMPAEIAESSGVWRVEKHPSKPMLADRQYVSFDVALPPQAKFLTLAATAAGDDIHADHAVWSGARLEPNE